MVHSPLRDYPVDFTVPRFCISDGFEARESETCVLHPPSHLLISDLYILETPWRFVAEFLGDLEIK